LCNWNVIAPWCFLGKWNCGSRQKDNSELIGNFMTCLFTFKMAQIWIYDFTLL
jgi:hypothetical protein